MNYETKYTFAAEDPSYQSILDTRLLQKRQGSYKIQLSID